MFGLASGFYDNYFVPPEVSCLIVGLNDAGKTALLERVKVTDFTVPGPSTGKRIAIQKDRNISIVNKTMVEKINENPVQLQKVQTKSPSRRRRFACPSPGSYNQLNFDSDEETDLVDSGGESKVHHRELSKEIIIELPSVNVTVSPPGSPNKRTSNGIEISVMGDNHVFNGNDNGSKDNNTRREIGSDEKEYDVKAGKKMLPLRLIRPTLGMNLGKIEACGAKVRLMDLGGTVKMRPLWERYYKDVHAITFVFDVSPSCEVSKLMEARAYYRCMCDDESLRGVPILIFANKTDTRRLKMVDDDNDENTSLLIGDTSLLDIAELFLSPPRGLKTATEFLGESDTHSSDCCGENGNISMFAGSAKTGEGVAPAFDWLIRKGADRVRQLRKSDDI